MIGIKNQQFGVEIEFTGITRREAANVLAPLLDTIFVDLQGFEQNILLGVHNGHEVFEALTVVIGSVHMDMEPAGAVDPSASVPQCSDRFLK